MFDVEELQLHSRRTYTPKPLDGAGGDAWSDTVAGVKYLYVPTPMAFADAQEFCTKKNGTLAYVGNGDQNVKVREVGKVNGCSTCKIWIGLSKETPAGKSERWLNPGVNTWAPYQKWTGGQPDNWGNGEACGIM